MHVKELRKFVVNLSDEEAEYIFGKWDKFQEVYDSSRSEITGRQSRGKPKFVVIETAEGDGYAWRMVDEAVQKLKSERIGWPSGCLTMEQVQNIHPGLYRIFWKLSDEERATGQHQERNSSLAAFGRMRDGRVWIAPINWVSPTDSNHPRFEETVQKIASVEIIREFPEL